MTATEILQFTEAIEQMQRGETRIAYNPTNASMASVYVHGRAEINEESMAIYVWEEDPYSPNYVTEDALRIIIEQTDFRFRYFG